MIKTKHIKPEGEYLYQEQQTLRKWYLWLALIVGFLISVAFTLDNFIEYKEGVPGAASFIVLGGLMLFISTFFIVSTAGSKMNIIATKEAIYFQWTPLNNNFNKVFWQNVQLITMIEYNSMGYGMRISEKYGSIYNAFGGYAINIITRGGNQFLLGTSQPEKLEELINEMKDIHYFEYENEIGKPKNDK